MKLIKRLCTYGIIATLVLSTGCASSTTKGDSTSVTEAAEGTQVSTSKEAAYKNKIFDTSYVHTINIEIAQEDWNDLLENASEQNFYPCNITIDGEEYSNVGIRTKGNSSLSQVVNSDSDRYSFKLDFNKYIKEQDYYGLEKLSLNNNIQDATYMKDYLTYTMMSEFGVASPYVSYSYITINGEEWGLYLNVEEVEESFLERNYGEDYGNLYKPETMEMNGENGFKMPQGFDPENLPEGFAPENMPEGFNPENMPEGFNPENMPEGINPENMPQMPQRESQGDTMKVPQGAESNGMQNGQGPRGAFGGPGSRNSLGADLKYTDDNYESYANIFNYAETDITNTDKDRLIASLKQLSEGTNLDEVLDVDALLRYFVVHNFVDNYDSYTGMLLHNYYLYEDNGKLTMLPWDYNLAFGAFGGMGGMGDKNNKGNMLPPNNNEVPDTNMAQDNNMVPNNNEAQDNEIQQNAKANQVQENVVPGEAPKWQMGQSGDATRMVNMAMDTPLSGASEEDRPMWSQLINNEEYKAKYHELFDEFLKNYMENDAIQDEIDRVAEMISPYVEKDPTAFYTYEEFTKGVETIKTFINLRGESIRKQLTGEIPSTTEEQNTFTGELVDASSINLSDMGSNDMGKEFANRGEKGQRGMKEKNNSSDADTNSGAQFKANTQN